MQRHTRLLLGCLLVVSLFLGGCGKSPGRDGGPGGSAPGQPDKTQMAGPTRGDSPQIETVSLNGPGGNPQDPAGAGRENNPNSGPGGPTNPGRRGPGQTGGVAIGGAGGNGPGGPVATTTIQPQAAAPSSVQAPAPSQEAYQAIVIFANDQLGTAVTPVYAGGATQEAIDLMTTLLPSQLQNQLYAAQNMAVSGYYGLLKGGVAALALGDCSEGASCQLSGDIPVDLSQATLGAYALQTPEAMPATPGEALQLMTLVYPKLAGLEFTQVADIPGYAFSTTTTSVAVVDGQPTFVSKVVLAGVMEAQGRTVVYAAVGLGETYSSLLNPFQATN